VSAPERDAPDDEVRRKAERIERERRRKPMFWRDLAHVGVLGWVFILPVVALSWIGHLLARTSGALWPAVVGVLGGVALGAYLVYRNVARSLEE